MNTPTAIALKERGLLAVMGEDAVSFLQGLLTQDVTKLAPNSALYAALLTPQGKMLHDMFLLPAPEGNGVLLDCEHVRLLDLQQRLMRYKLRAKITLEDWSDNYKVYALLFVESLSTGWQNGAFLYTDPRFKALGMRAIVATNDSEHWLSAQKATHALYDTYDFHRLQLGIADGSRDMPPEDSYPLDWGLEPLHGVDFSKGCYVGQEVTARMKHRDAVRKQPYIVHTNAPLPAPGTPVLAAERKIGELRSSIKADPQAYVGIALLRKDWLEEAQAAGTQLRAENTALVEVRQPAWLNN